MKLLAELQRVVGVPTTLYEHQRGTESPSTVDSGAPISSHAFDVSPRIFLIFSRLTNSRGLLVGLCSQALKSFIVTECSTAAFEADTLTAFNPSGVPSTYRLVRIDARPSATVSYRLPAVTRTEFSGPSRSRIVTLHERTRITGFSTENCASACRNWMKLEDCLNCEPWIFKSCLRGCYKFRTKNADELHANCTMIWASR